MSPSPLRHAPPEAAFELLEEAEVLAHDILVAVHQEGSDRPQLTADALELVGEVEQGVMQGLEADLSGLRQRVRRLRDLRDRARSVDVSRASTPAPHRLF